MKKTVLNTLVILLFLTSSLVVTQVLEMVEADTPTSTQTWNKIYVEGAQDAAWSVIQTVDGGYALACNMWSLSTGGMDAWLIKTDAFGNVQWNVSYGGPNWDGANSLVATSDGGYAIAGSTGSFGAGSMDYWLIKTDSSGNMQWNKTYGGGGTEYGRAVIESSDGGYLVAGHAFSSVAEGRENFWLVKTDLSGNLEWSQTYGGTESELAYSIVEAPEGGYAVAGYAGSFGAKNNCWLVRTDSLGNMHWNKTFSARGSFGSHSLVLTSDYGFALTGMAYPYSFNSSDLWIAKTDASGDLEWQQTYNGKGMEHAYALVSTSDGGYAVAGFTTPASAEETDCLLVKTDASGNMQWNKTYGGPSADAAYSMVQTTDGGYALAGSWSYLTNSYLGGSVWLIKTDSEGNTADLPPSPTPKPSSAPTVSPTIAPTSTPEPTPAPSANPTATPQLNQTPTLKPTPLPTLPPSPTLAPIAESTPKPPAAVAPQQQIAQSDIEPTNGAPIGWVPMAIAAFAVSAIGFAAYGLRKLKTEF